MSKTLLSRLAMFELLDACGPLTMTEIAQRSGLDLTVVSRTVSACEAGGWLTRQGGRVGLGPRCTLLGHTGPFADFVSAASRLVHAVAGVTGLDTHAYGLIGTQAAIIAAAAGRSGSTASTAIGMGAHTPLHATAGGRAIAAQLDPDVLGQLLPSEPYPDAASVIAATAGTMAATVFSPEPRSADRLGGPLPRTRAELDTQLATIRAERLAADTGSLHPAIHCLAVPWPQPALPASLGCLASADLLDAHRPMVLQTLAAAARPGATPDTVIASAAGSLSPSSMPSHPGRLLAGEDADRHRQHDRVVEEAGDAMHHHVPAHGLRGDVHVGDGERGSQREREIQEVRRHRGHAPGKFQTATRVIGRIRRAFLGVIVAGVEPRVTSVQQHPGGNNRDAAEDPDQLPVSGIFAVGEHRIGAGHPDQAGGDRADETEPGAGQQLLAETASQLDEVRPAPTTAHDDETDSQVARGQEIPAGQVRQVAARGLR
jgi:DNA-binding IclR family transcriptional regulator